MYIFIFNNHTHSDFIKPGPDIKTRIGILYLIKKYPLLLAIMDLLLILSSFRLFSQTAASTGLFLSKIPGFLHESISADKAAIIGRFSELGLLVDLIEKENYFNDISINIISSGEISDLSRIRYNDLTAIISAESSEGK